jgi:hypothetical protein
MTFRSMVKKIRNLPMWAKIGIGIASLVTLCFVAIIAFSIAYIAIDIYFGEPWCRYDEEMVYCYDIKKGTGITARREF